MMIGEVANCSEYQDEQTRRAFILEFSTADAAKSVLASSAIHYSDPRCLP